MLDKLDVALNRAWTGEPLVFEVRERYETLAEPRAVKPWLDSATDERLSSYDADAKRLVVGDVLSLPSIIQP